MSKYELTVSEDYVQDWGIVEAIRELFQNALDQQTTNPDNQMFFSYDKEKQQLSVGNRLSILNPNTLLLGASSKQNDDSTIGQFGEGYKIATLVLTRLARKVTFYNFGRREVWNPRFVDSRRYGARVLTFFVDKKYPWQGVPDNNLTITVDGITPEEYAKIVDSNLHLNPPKHYYSTEYGRILLDEQSKGKVYVNGLYVTTYSAYTYGYDFKPAHLKLDRDRKLVSDFHLKWLSSKMWNNCSDEMIETAVHLVESNAADVAQLDDTDALYGRKGQLTTIADTALVKFKEEHGANAVPVSSNGEMALLSRSHKPVVVSDSYKNVLKKSSEYKEPELTDELTFVEKLENWYSRHQFGITTKASEEFKRLLEEEKSNG